MIESRKVYEKFISYIDWDKSPNGWENGQLKKNVPESAKKAFEEYIKLQTSKKPFVKKEIE